MAQNCVQYGHLGSGKTESVRSIVEEAVKRYGEENVNSVMSSSGNIADLLEYGMDSKLIQILICDDATLRGISDTDLRKYFKARHLYRAVSGNDNGYILTIFNVHRFHGLATELRTNIDVAIWKTPPTNPYDRSVVKGFVGDDGYKDLQFIEQQRFENPEWNAVSVFTSRLWKGLLLLPLAEKNYLREVVRPKIELTWGELISVVGCI